MMDYGRLINRSFEIAWKYKWLWIFGMFAQGGMYLRTDYLIGNGSSPFAMIDPESIDPTMLFEKLFTIYIAIIPIFVIIMLLGILAQGALIDSVNRIERGGIHSFSTAFSAGIDNFLKMLALGIIWFFTFGIFIVVGIVLISIGFVVHTAVGVLGILLGIPISFMILFLTINLLVLASRAVVVRRTSIFAGIDEGYTLTKMHFGHCFVMFLIIVGLSLGFGIVNSILFFIINFPVDAIMAMLNLQSFAAVLVAFIIGTPVFLIIGGILGVFFSSLYTLFYFELVEPKQDQRTEISTQPPSDPSLPQSI